MGLREKGRGLMEGGCEALPVCDTNEINHLATIAWVQHSSPPEHDLEKPALAQAVWEPIFRKDCAQTKG
jgi:hypothetical protein